MISAGETPASHALVIANEVRQQSQRDAAVIAARCARNRGEVRQQSINKGFDYIILDFDYIILDLDYIILDLDYIIRVFD